MEDEVSDETRERLRKAISLGSKSAKKFQKFLDTGINKVLEGKLVRQIEKLQVLLQSGGLDSEKLIQEFDKLYGVVQKCFKNSDLSSAAIHALILCLFDYSRREEEFTELDPEWRYIFFDIFENSPRISEATLNYVLDDHNIDNSKVDNPNCLWFDRIPFYFRAIALNPTISIDMLKILQHRADRAADFQLLLNPTSSIDLLLSLTPHSVTTHIISGDSTVEDEFPEIFKFLKSRIKFMKEEYLTGTLLYESENHHQSITPIDFLLFAWRLSEFAKSYPDYFQNLLSCRKDNVLLQLINSVKNVEFVNRALIIQNHFPEPGLLDVTAFNKAIGELVEAMFNGSFSQFPYA